MKIGLIGCGLIGQKRLDNLPSGIDVSIVCDTSIDRAQNLAEKYNCKSTDNWKDVIKDPTVQAIFIATTNNCLAQFTIESIKHNKHVLVEKPGARNLKEFKDVINAYNKNRNLVVEIGYNHRFHPAIMQAKEIIDSKEYGDVMFLRAKYGHGGRLGYEKEWRFDPAISGGGELLDQGSHLIDLTNFFSGQMNEVIGMTANFFWKSSLEDASFLIMKNEQGQIAHLSATCVEWKNIFMFEIFLKTAKLQIDGLGRSYGKETLTIYKMKPEMGPPDVNIMEFDGNDDSWSFQNKAFFDRIKSSDYSNTSLTDSQYVLEQIDKIYKGKK